jgi:protein-S-isoprenylcysteine O-methyltransferase Ste14
MRRVAGIVHSATGGGCRRVPRVVYGFPRQRYRTPFPALVSTDDSPLEPPPDRRTAGVIAPPPLLPLAVIVVAEVLRWLAPLPSFGTEWWRRGIALVVLLCALTLAGAAVLVLRRARTPVEPWKPTRSIVAHGPYAMSRNPIYVAFLGMQLAYAWGRGNAWGMLLLPLSAWLLHWGVIAREERYLRERFGAPYEAYLRRVGRWF